jgi:hypothetical protein
MCTFFVWNFFLLIKISCFTVISNHLILDRGTETIDMATIHAFLIEHADPSLIGGVTVHYGPSTNNKVQI